MPPKKNVSKHGTEAGQMTRVEAYKVKSAYKNLVSINDEISKNIKNILNNNIWNLNDKFDELKEYYDFINNTGKIAWENNIQYLDYENFPPVLNEISLKSFENGDYASKYVDTKRGANVKETESKYAKRIIFWTKTFEPLKQYQGVDDLSWIVPNNRILMYEIMKYHNEKNNKLATLNQEFKGLVRIIKLIMGEENELRYKYSALQIAITDMGNLSDDDNLNVTDQELRTFIPYEQLIDIVDQLEEQYKNLKTKSPNNKKDLLKLHLRHLAVAIMVYDFPSRHEKYDLNIIENESQSEKDKNYIIISDSGDCKFILNEIVKLHKPIKYNLNSKQMTGFNKKLNKLLKYSIKEYPRKYLFVSDKNEKVTHHTVSGWVRDILPNKNMSIDGFRSAFVSYWKPLWSNSRIKICATRMRTSVDEINRAYFKFYKSPEQLVKVKIEPDVELQTRANTGWSKDGGLIIDDNNKPKQTVQKAQVALPVKVALPYKEIVPIQTVARRTVVQDVASKKAANFRKWYENRENKIKHNEQVKERSNKPSTYLKRYLRELNGGRLDFNTLQQSTKEKYQIYLEGNQFKSRLDM